jgi:alanine racemase
VAAFGKLVHRLEATHRMTIRYAQVTASSAIVESIPDDLNTIAPGHLTYGISPIYGVEAETLGFRQALRSIRARVIHTGTHQPGDDLAMGALNARMHTAVLLLGIDNGYDFAPGATVLLRGRRCPVLSVTAEYTVVDTSALPSVAVGDVATIVGGDEGDTLTLHEVAALRGRSPGYWMMGFRRVPLRYQN